MPPKEHIAWVEIINHDGIFIRDEGRMAQLEKEMTKPAEQYPSCVLFIGKAVKDQAIRHVFRHNTRKKSADDGIVNLRLNASTSLFRNPILFADSNPSIRIPARISPTPNTVSYPTVWPLSHDSSVYEILFGRLLFMFCDVICVFADDFPSLEKVAENLKNWAKVASASGTLVPAKVIIVASSNCSSATYDQLQRDDFQSILSNGNPDHLHEAFSSITFMHLANDQISPMARHRPLREQILRELDEVRHCRVYNRCLFSAVHLSAFFTLAVQHVAKSVREPYDFIRASQYLSAGTDFDKHFCTFLHLTIKARIPRNDAASFIASSILLDSYPPGRQCE